MNKIIYGLLFGLLSGLSWAGSTSTPISKILSFSAGPAWSQAGETKTVWLQPDYANTYVPATPEQVLAIGELFMGVQYSFFDLGFQQFGLAVGTSSTVKLQGEIWETADPLFNNFSYQYKLSQTHVAVKTKWLSNHWSDTLLPYLSASLGVAWNKSYQFSMSPLIFEALPVAGFQDHQETAFIYTVGIGAHKVLTAHWQVGLGYEFSDWGRSSLSAAPGQILNNGLSLNHLQVQQLQFIINYLF